MSIQRFNSNARMSQAVVHNGVVYLAGQVADDLSGGVADQTRQILAKIDAVLAQAGSDKSRLLTCTVWLADMAGFAEMNAVWDAWVSPGNPPARATVESRLAGEGYRVEIGGIAAV